MPSASDYGGIQYLKGSDVPEAGQLFSIDYAEPFTFERDDKPDETKLLLYFIGDKRALPLNSTNCRKCIDLFGDDYDGWKGKPITCYSHTTTYGPGVVVRAPSKAELKTATK